MDENVKQTRDTLLRAIEEKVDATALNPTSLEQLARAYAMVVSAKPESTESGYAFTS